MTCKGQDGGLIRVFLLLFFLLSAVSGCQSVAEQAKSANVQDAESTIYLVRHAEKQKDVPNPSLTDAGTTRAEKLAELLEPKGVNVIHSTDYARTRETAVPLANRLGLDVLIYDPRDLSGFAAKLIEWPGTHLVVGHSNTTPQLVTALGGEAGPPIVEATEYDRLYVVTILPDGEVISTLQRYGTSTDISTKE